MRTSDGTNGGGALLDLGDDARGSAGDRHDVCKGREGTITLRVGRGRLGVVFFATRLALEVAGKGALGLGDGIAKCPVSRWK